MIKNVQTQFVTILICHTAQSQPLRRQRNLHPLEVIKYINVRNNVLRAVLNQVVKNKSKAYELCYTLGTASIFHNCTNKQNDLCW